MDKRRAVVFTLLVMAVFFEGDKLLLQGVSGKMSKIECSVEVAVGVNACKEVLEGKPPPPQCCERVRVSHEECVCPLVTPHLAALIDVNKAIRLIEGCGRRVPRHHTCGSITTP